MPTLLRWTALAAVVVLFCASGARAGVIDDTDKRAKALWLPVQGQDCPATCTGAGLVAVTLAPADFSRAACSGFPRRDDDDDFYIGTWRNQGGVRVCQAADDDDDAKARLFYDRYYCACLPRKPGGTLMDAFWAPTGGAFSFACGAGYSADPDLCLATVNGVQYVGQRDDDDDECAYYATGAVTGSRGRRTKAYSKLCVTQRFAWLAFDKYFSDD